jgi:post-segregation antitoxin (ccd killing protein)
MSVLGIAMVLSLSACVMEFDNAGSMVSGALKEYKEAVDMSNNYQSGQSIELNLEMKAATAVFESTDDKLADVKFSYSSEALKPEFVVKADKINIKNKIENYSFGKHVNQWDVKLTDKLPLDVELQADASDIKLDMSHMLLSSIDAELNASAAKIYFDESNKEQFDKFKLNADASNVSIYGAGNIGYDNFDIDVNASKITVDLTGANEGNGEVRIDANASTVKLKLPEDVGVHLVIDKYEISSVNIDDNEMLSQSKKEFVSKNYGNSERTLKIYADLNLTTLTIE